MTHDPTRDCEHGRLKGKCDVCDLQAEAEADKIIIEYHEATIKRLQYEVDAIPAIKEERDALAAEVLEQCRINGMSAEREAALRVEVERLNKALTWEQNRAERIGTHGPGCHTWGPAHYECLLRVNAELVEALRVARHMIVEDGTPIGWSVDRLSEVIAKATGETK
jgi:hypothetical protein